MGRLTRLFLTYQEQAEFLFIYVHEGPHQGLIPVPSALQPNGKNRLAYIAAGLRFFGITFPCLLDGVQMEVEKAYGAFPARLLIVDREGRIALDAGRG